jgi:branched-chain amino acid transport system ATP-binding protein
MLAVRGLRAGYGATPVLLGVDLDVGPGEVVGVAGLNGVGKTTLLRALSGVVRCSADQLSLDGRPRPAHPRKIAARGLIHVPEGRRVFADLSVIDNLRYGAGAVGRWAQARQRLDDVFAEFPRLPELAGRRAGLLSGGEQQMVAVARGLMAMPRVLVVDEFSLGLSPKATLEICRTIVRAARRDGFALLMVDQNLALLASHCDRIYQLRDGIAEPFDSAGGQDTIKAAYF